MINFYSKIKNSKEPFNPNFNIHKLIIGSSGSGKSNCVLNLIKQFNGTFSSIDIYTRQPDEPLYKFLNETYKKQNKLNEEPLLNIFEGIDELKDLKKYDPDENHLVIFDDMILEKNLSRVAEYYIRCRKRGVSVIFISQSYYMNNQDWKIIRKQANYIIIKKIASIKELISIIKDYSLSLSKERFLKLYEDITKENKFNFLLLDLDAEDDFKFRVNFEVIKL